MQTYLTQIVKNNKKKMLLLAIATAGLFAIPIIAGAGAAPSKLIFSHSKHEGNAECENCHKPAEKLMTKPTHEDCGACHKEEINDNAAEKKCNMCHADPAQETNMRKGQFFADVNFDHRVHVAKQVECKSCHDTTTNNVVLGNELLPKMDKCVACHQEKQAAAVLNKKCDACHPAGYLQTRPANHTPLWGQRHGKLIDQNTINTKCDVCHNATNGNDCMNCHRREKPKSHTMGFRLRAHAQKAQLDRQSCSTCHNQSDCVNCHKVTPPMNHNSAMFGSPYDRHCNTACHLEGASNYTVALGGIGANCAFCHDAGVITGKHQSGPQRASSSFPHYSQSCLTCHKTGGMAANKIPRHRVDDEIGCPQCH